MCGIVGYIGKKRNNIETLVDGLKRLEYRGYDSAGIDVIDNNCASSQHHIDAGLVNRVDSGVLLWISP